MQLLNAYQNGAPQYWVTVRPEPAGQFTAQAVGLPDVYAAAATREEALAKVQETLRGLVASGQLVSIEVQTENPLLKWAGRRDPNDPEEQAFLAILAEQEREDLEQTLRELDQQCSNSSSTPTT
jgi:predicted RNase H-like HicB family nuclease